MDFTDDKSTMARQTLPITCTNADLGLYIQMTSLGDNELI